MLEIEAIADHGEGQRNDATGRRAANNTCGEQELDAWRQRAHDETSQNDNKADLDDERLAPGVAERAQHRLKNRIRLREGRREQGHGPSADGQIPSDGGNDRIDDPHGHGADEATSREHKKQGHVLKRIPEGQPLKFERRATL